MTQKKTIEEILDKFFNKIVDDEETYEKCIKQAKSDISALVKEIIGEDSIEKICEQVHKAYCKYHLEHKGTEYWTGGDYSKLTEEGKEYDRRTVRAVLAEQRQRAKERGVEI
jgi:3-keto-L-gulonate-6-phosphate decarboxylase